MYIQLHSCIYIFLSQAVQFGWTTCWAYVGFVKSPRPSKQKFPGPSTRVGCLFLMRKIATQSPKSWMFWAPWFGNWWFSPFVLLTNMHIYIYTHVIETSKKIDKSLAPARQVLVVGMFEIALCCVWCFFHTAGPLFQGRSADPFQILGTEARNPWRNHGERILQCGPKKQL